MADTRCPHCDHTFAAAEITDEWCESCGKKIPEVILKDVRPRPHLRKPHPVPLPPAPTPAQRAQSARESKTRAAGLVLLVASSLGGIACLAWGAFNRAGGEPAGAAVWAGAVAVAAFLAGLWMLTTGRVPEE